MFEPEFNFDLGLGDTGKGSEDAYNRDRKYYLMGRTGYPQSPPQGLSGRRRGCYNMGYNVSKALDWDDLGF